MSIKILILRPSTLDLRLVLIMPEEETSPLLSAAMKGKTASRERSGSTESTPLLSSSSATPRYDGDIDEHDENAALLDQSNRTDGQSLALAIKPTRRWPSFVAMGVLAAAVIAIIVLAFIVPEAVQEYSEQAAVVEPTNLALDSITPTGVRARIQAKFHLDGSKVSNPNVRNIGRAVTWVAYQLESKETKVDVRLPDYNNILLGSAIVPPLLVNLRDGDTTQFDFVIDITPGDLEGIRIIAKEWLDGTLDSLRLDGQADVTVKSGIFPLGTHFISESLVFEGQSLYSSFGSTLYMGRKATLWLIGTKLGLTLL